jgi:hypothetical protein
MTSPSYIEAVEKSIDQQDEKSVRIIELEAKLDKAMEALREVTQTLVWMPFGSCRGYPENLLTPNEAEDLAKAVLAELGGERK